ncbi:S-phase kinase-associated protein 2-like protein [Dinothrombium tinctorium]|uniref:S-phase kinase-associated protein 2-like protein n=1 Tax=Dinothrombium tinctorium TaxID=1965070 RepID=A0A3S4R6C6_9ACAR|nr:S-phase kinase-associated protein 2-like protein [Dinothrombium tinctorium]RWS12542.1 S-phase kinase-associated protein 2-like protein [Dinothrombium tinctorium]RWS12598.1 S-phase kinase-associated protein 2-like protein [Dinothrombium tinctorium]
MDSSTAPRATVKWDISLEKAKALLKELGVGFLPLNENVFTLTQNSTGTQSTCLTPTLNAISLAESSNKRVKSNIRLSDGEINADEQNIDDERCSIDKLSDELLLRIFKCLPKSVVATKCALVSKRWNCIASDASFWKKIDLTRKQLNGKQLCAALQLGVLYARLTAIEINDSLTFTKTLCLQYLDLTMAVISVNSLNAILNACETSLKKLSLEGNNIDELTLDLLCEKHHKLEILNLALCRLQNGAGSFQSKLPSSLKELDMSWIANLNLSAIVKYLPASLLRLNLSGYRSNFTDYDMDYLTIKCCNIEELNISDCNFLTSKSMLFIRDRLHKLECLNISRCHSIVFHDFMSFKSLKTLVINGISPSNTIETSKFQISKQIFSTIARPTVGNKRYLMWDVIMD